MGLSVRRTRPVGATDLELVRQQSDRALERRSTPETLRPDLLAAARASQRAAPIGPLEQLRSASTLDDGAVAAARDHLLATLDRNGDTAGAAQPRR